MTPVTRTAARCAAGPPRPSTGSPASLAGTENGPLTGDGALALSVCRSTLAGAVRLRDTSGYLLLGASCGGNTITGPVSLDGNTGGVEVSDNAITGPLRCDGNAPAPVQTGNTVDGPRSGQCR